jgi:hypothetical protein
VQFFALFLQSSTAVLAPQGMAQDLLFVAATGARTGFWARFAASSISIEPVRPLLYTFTECVWARG